MYNGKYVALQLTNFSIPISGDFEFARFIRYDGKKIIKVIPRYVRSTERYCFCVTNCKYCKCFPLPSEAPVKLWGNCECLTEYRVVTSDLNSTLFNIGGAIVERDPELDSDSDSFWDSPYTSGYETDIYADW